MGFSTLKIPRPESKDDIPNKYTRGLKYIKKISYVKQENKDEEVPRVNNDMPAAGSLPSIQIVVLSICLGIVGILGIAFDAERPAVLAAVIVVGVSFVFWRNGKQTRGKENSPNNNDGDPIAVQETSPNKNNTPSKSVHRRGVSPKIEKLSSHLGNNMILKSPEQLKKQTDEQNERAFNARHKKTMQDAGETGPSGKEVGRQPDYGMIDRTPLQPVGTAKDNRQSVGDIVANLEEKMAKKRKSAERSKAMTGTIEHYTKQMDEAPSESEARGIYHMTLLKAMRDNKAREQIDDAAADAKANEGLATCTLKWSNTDDLDLHCYFKNNDGEVEHVYFGNKETKDGRGKLDVDRNANDKRTTTNPVENIFWNKPKEGCYKFFVVNYRPRESRTSEGGYTSFSVELKLPNDGFSKVYHGVWLSETGKTPKAAFSFEWTSSNTVDQFSRANDDFLPLEILKSGPLDVDPELAHFMLSDREFEDVFGMTKSKFSSLAGWQQETELRKNGLFFKRGNARN